MINCRGCRTDGVKTFFCNDLCEIRKCAEKKGITTCGSCSERDHCQPVGMVIENNQAARNNLEEMKLL